MRTSIKTTSGRELTGGADRFGAVAGLTDDLDAGLRLEDHAEACAHERLIVGQEDTDHRSLEYGSRARTA